MGSSSHASAPFCFFSFLLTVSSLYVSMFAIIAANFIPCFLGSQQETFLVAACAHRTLGLRGCSLAPLPTCRRKYHMAPAPSAAAPPPKPLTKQVTRQLPQSVKLARSLSKFADPSDRSPTESLKSSSPLPRHIIRPDSTRKLWWDAYAVIILIYAVIVAPLRLSFDVEDYCPSSVWILEAVIDVCFVIDLVLNFFTAVYVSHLSSTHSDARVRCWRGDRSARGALLLF
jgi:hypothetical protein